jgi:hypothetical protein
MTANNKTAVLFPAMLISLLAMACDDNSTEPIAQPVFEGREKVVVTGYSDHLMEPFISRDGSILMFNNYNGAPNTNIHWARLVNESTFEYQGEISGLNSLSLDGVPSMDQHQNLYFVSLREYEQTLESVYSTTFINGTVAPTIAQVLNLSKHSPGWVNFDLEISADGETLFFADGRFDQSGGPYEADLSIARKINGEFQRLVNSDEVLQHVNTADHLEYAASISSNNCELYFTRVIAPLTSQSMPEIFVATRPTEEDTFGVPRKIESITGFVEAPTLSPDGKVLYYHTMDLDGKFALYLTRRSE